MIWLEVGAQRLQQKSTNSSMITVLFLRVFPKLPFFVGTRHVFLSFFFEGRVVGGVDMLYLIRFVVSIAFLQGL